MELVVFDLDGTLLDGSSSISGYTSETLRLLAERGIAYTVATGRTLHGAKAVLEGHRFTLPQAYKNGVMIWHPDTKRLSSESTLTQDELQSVLQACSTHGVSPFVFTLDDSNGSTVYHPPKLSEVELKLIEHLGVEDRLKVRPLKELRPGLAITHVNSIGDGDAIKAVLRDVSNAPHLVAYSGVALEGQQWRWLDVHHSDANKGRAIEKMKSLLGLERVICFGDSDNDLSMFEAADESYAPANANDAIRSAATQVIGHHDEEGIARFLRERFELAT